MENREEKECQRDIEIDFINNKRDIALILSPEESLLYGYSRTITLKQLEEMKTSCEMDFEIIDE